VAKTFKQQGKQQTTRGVFLLRTVEKGERWKEWLTTNRKKNTRGGKKAKGRRAGNPVGQNFAIGKKGRRENKASAMAELRGGVQPKEI